MRKYGCEKRIDESKFDCEMDLRDRYDREFSRHIG